MVTDLLELPVDHDWLPGRALVRTVFNVIVQALRRGEKVKIDGLGTFRTKTFLRRPRFSSYPRQVTVVRFRPSNPLIKELNAPRDPANS